MNAPEQYELNLKRFIRAPREKVFDAFTKSEALAAWHCPRGMTVAQATADARVGGAYRVVMKSREGMTPTAAGEYRELRRPEFLAFTWYWENGSMGPEIKTLVEIRLLERDGGTELQFRHSGFPAASARDGHLGGWKSVLNRLSDYLDPKGSAGTLTLYGDPRSSYTRSVRMGLVEKGVAFTHLPSPPHSPEILAHNPFGRIPVLLDGDTEIYETAAILRHVDEGFSGPPLQPVMLHDRVRCEQWTSLVVGHFYGAMVVRYVLQYVFPKGPGDQPDRKVIDSALPEIEKQLDVLESAYAASDTLAGNTVSIADLLVAPILAYVEMFPEGKRLMDARPNIRRAQSAIRQRASFQATDPAAAKQ